jgi:hypothetical protein
MIRSVISFLFCVDFFPFNCVPKNLLGFLSFVELIFAARFYPRIEKLPPIKFGR